MDRHYINLVDEQRFTEETDDSHVQADMTGQIIEFVTVKKLTLKSAAKLFTISESILGQVMKGQLGALSDDELAEIVNQILIIKAGQP